MKKTILDTLKHSTIKHSRLVTFLYVSYNFVSLENKSFIITSQVCFGVDIINILKYQYHKTMYEYVQS